MAFYREKVNRHFFLPYFFLIYFIALCPKVTYAQYLDYPSAEQTALLGSNLVPLGAESGKTNPAGLVSISKFTFRFTYQNRYQLSDLSQISLETFLPVGGGVLGLGMDHFGFSHVFQTQHLSLTYALPLSPEISIALRPTYQAFRLLNIYFHHTISVASGLRLSLGKEVALGAYWSNIINRTFQNPYFTSLSSPPKFSLGIGYTPWASKVAYYTSISKLLHHDISIQMGLEYLWSDFIFRFSTSYNPIRLALGMRIPVLPVILDLATSYHHALGFVPCVTFTF